MLKRHEEILYFYSSRVMDEWSKLSEEIMGAEIFKKVYFDYERLRDGAQ